MWIVIARSPTQRGRFRCDSGADGQSLDSDDRSPASFVASSHSCVALNRRPAPGIPHSLEPLAEIGKRRIFCPLTETSGGVDVKSVAEQSGDAVGGEDSDSEHQMAERLEMAADPQVAATELILDAGIAASWRMNTKRMADIISACRR
jgi:hypothetical protein